MHDQQQRLAVGGADAAAGRTAASAVVGGETEVASAPLAFRRLPQRTTLALRVRRKTTKRNWSRVGRLDRRHGWRNGGNGGIPYGATTPTRQAFPQRWANGFEYKKKSSTGKVLLLLLSLLRL